MARADMLIYSIKHFLKEIKSQKRILMIKKFLKKSIVLKL